MTTPYELAKWTLEHEDQPWWESFWKEDALAFAREVIILTDALVMNNREHEKERRRWNGGFEG